MSKGKITKQDEYVEYPEYDKISFFISMNTNPIGIIDPKKFYEEFLSLLTDIGLPFDKKSFVKYLEFFKEAKNNKKVADRKFKEYVYRGY